MIKKRGELVKKEPELYKKRGELYKKTVEIDDNPYYSKCMRIFCSWNEHYSRRHSTNALLLLLTPSESYLSLSTITHF
ncbi:hypothetical protein AB685_02410 [Bacillus sp. LL01]|nr:hypothetical protein AB685_02410 [Bacillus sp. LL01]